MWGTSFTELAKQAEAAAAAAAQTASTTSTSSWFNLDALQQTDEQKAAAAAAANAKPPPPPEKPVSSYSSSFFSTAAASLPIPAPLPKPSPKGKLQVAIPPTRAAAPAPTTTSNTNTTDVKNAEAPPPAPAPADVVVKDEGKTKPVAAVASSSSSLPPPPLPAPAKVEETTPAPTGVIADEKPPLQETAPAVKEEKGTAVEDNNNNNNNAHNDDDDADNDDDDVMSGDEGWGDDVDLVDSTEAEEDDEGAKEAQKEEKKEIDTQKLSLSSSEQTSPVVLSTNGAGAKDEEAAAASAASQDEIPESTTTDSEKAAHHGDEPGEAEQEDVSDDKPTVNPEPSAEVHTSAANVDDMKGKESAEKEEPAEMTPKADGSSVADKAEEFKKNVVEEEKGNLEHAVPASPSQPTKKILMLSSMQSLNRHASQKQENALTILRGRQLEAQVIDATDPKNKTWREELFGMAEGVREYPLFFLLDLTDGETTFWGNFERFEYANDRGTLVDELTGKNTTPWDPSMFVEDEAPKSSTPRSNGHATSTALAAEKEEMMKTFSEQLKRVEENHQAELAEMEKKREQAVKDALASVTHDGCIAERKSLEQKLTEQIQQKHEKLSEVLKTNEGFKLKIDVLKREVAGMQQLLENRDSDLGKASAVHKRDLKVLQEQLLDREEKASKAKQQAEQAEAARQSMAEEFEKTKKEYLELKNRAREITTELKDRRAECGHLRNKVDEMSETNENLERSVESLTYQLSNHNISKTEKDGEMDRLRNDLDTANNKVKELQAEMQTKESAAEKALNDYKKKAQNSLAMANSRTASAVEAKEEAELEARAARSTADSAMDRAVKAEIASKEAVAEAKARVADMEQQTEKAKAELSQSTKDMEIFRNKADELQKELDALVGEKNKLVTDLAHAQGRCEEEQGRCRTLQDECSRYKQQAQTARDEISKLRQQLRRVESSKSLNDEESTKKVPKNEPPASERDDATISMLQQQLRDANAVIEDLKAALNNAAESHESASSPEHHAAEGNGSHDSTPLFYAMEKQAELKTARNEINRLANLLADVQSEKMEAIEAKEDMRQKMEDAEAKLKRFQKLGNTAEEEEKGLEPMPKNSGATNIEYLKNIMMRYLKAKTVAEKKALVPVIAAVLCLTPEEQEGAIKSLEESSSIGAVGNTLFESISGRFM